jgi:hypothetical protein
MSHPHAMAKAYQEQLLHDAELDQIRNRIAPQERRPAQTRISIVLRGLKRRPDQALICTVLRGLKRKPKASQPRRVPAGLDSNLV